MSDWPLTIHVVLYVLVPVVIGGLIAKWLWNRHHRR
jgi:hypothetical protein